MIEPCAPRCEVMAGFVRADMFCDAGVSRRARSLLDREEREALARLRPAGARRDYLAAHALLREMVADRVGCEPGHVGLRPSRRGRPELVAPAEATHLRLSLSHADGIALCAVTERWAVGADVESLRNLGADTRSVAETICSWREKTALALLPRASRRDYLLSLWTRKEAIAKAIGLGFYLPLDRLEVGDDGLYRPDGKPDRHARGARVVSLRLTGTHLAAIAVLGAPASRFTISIREAAPRADRLWTVGREP